MAKLKKELKDILDKYGIDPQDKSNLWDCHGTLVLYHKAYEVIAAQENIKFDPPTVIEGNGANKIVSLLVVGHMGDRSEWSIGEAAPSNCANKYPYAMAEKRAKDRVIGKLVGLAQYVYSEDEAEDFKKEDPPRISIDLPTDGMNAGEWINERMTNLQMFVVNGKRPTQDLFEKRVWKIENDPLFKELSVAQHNVWLSTRNGLQDKLTERLNIKETA